MPIRRRWPKVLGAMVVLLVALVLLWDWNWFRPLVEAQASSALGRKVTLGHFDIRLARYPQLVLDQIVVANPDEFPPDSSMATIDRLAIRIDPWALFDHKAMLTEIDIEHPEGDLKPGPSGTPNWKLAAGGGDSTPSPHPWQVDVGSLIIRDGHIHFLDPKLKSDFTLDAHTQDARGGGEPGIYVGIDGRYAAQPISGRFIGGSVLSLRDPKDRYPVDLKLANGATKVSLQGTLLEPLKFGGADLKLELSGDDLSNLYPLTGIPLAPTPPYKLGGQLDYEGRKVRFRDFAGTVGNSDLEGDIEVQLGGVRPYFRADMNSRKVVLADLRGFIGAAPGKTDDSENLSKQQQQEHAQQESTGKLLPDKPINLPKLRSVDFDVRYKGQRIESESTPLDNLVANLKVEDGKLALQPLSFGVGSGAIVLNLRLDGQDNLVHAVGDVDFRKVDLSRIMQSTGVFKGAGTIGGSAKIDTSGNSLAQMLGHGDGELKLFMSGGNLSALLVDLAGLDFGNSVVSALGIPSRAQLRCLVTDFGLNKGVLDTRTFIFDTSAANVIGSGNINLRDEQVDYKLSTEPKRLNIGSLAAPILIRGPLKDPSIHPDPVVLAARGGAAVVLGVFLTPLAALLPTIQLGLGKDHNCDELLATVQTAAKVPVRTAPKSLARH
ncbi:MAG: AsmA family protein [Nevskiales bacterium]